MRHHPTTCCFTLSLILCGLVCQGAAPAPHAAKVQGYAQQRVREKLDRGVVALRTDDGKTYVSWRLLDSDPAGAAFHVYRRSAGGEERITKEPVRKTTDFVDASAPKSPCDYFVREIDDSRDLNSSGGTHPGSRADGPYIRIPLAGNHTVQKVGIADLDGDGRYDFVVKQPADNIDPYEKYWKPSPDTYKLEAYGHDGKFLWRYDLGWAIERGIWYSPYVVCDLDGDGKAEVAVKTGEGDPRDADGRVMAGPEYLTILDGLTGKPRARIDWPSREPFEGKYNYWSRNQLGVAYLDGKTPCLIVARGTYTYMTAVAYEFHGNQLRELWRWDGQNSTPPIRGQGAHWMHAADVDGDGRDEVLLGSVTLDDDGSVLWRTGLGHPDSFYLGDIDPERPGLEIYFNIETANKRNSMCLVEAATGKILWGHDQPTKHIHSSGFCSDVTAEYPGSECYGGERDSADKRWLRTAKGKVISNEDMSLGPRPVYWDADPQRELIRGSKLFKYHGPTLPVKLEGSFVAVADLLGDWREEIIMSVPGELRIYSTTIPAADRRVTLMRDPIYRGDVTMAAMGYYQCPMTNYDMATKKP